VGAYNCYFSTFIGAKNLSVTMGGVYKVPALYMESDIVFTNTVPISAYRGAGRPDIAYAVERLIDYAAHEHGFDPVALRRRNFIPLADFPYRTANGTLYDTCDCAQVMDRALLLSDYAGFAKRRAESEQRGKLRGIGLATYLEISGAGAVPKDQVQGEFADDATLAVYGVTGASGQGHETSFAQIIETTLGLPATQVRYHAGDPSRSMVGNGTGGSRTLYGAGSAIKDLCVKIIALAKPLAAQALGCTANDVNFAQGQWQHAGNASKTLSMTAFLKGLTSAQLKTLQAMGEAQSGSTFPNGCHVAEVEIDPRSGVTEVVNYTAIDDLGTVISPQLVEGQVHGGVIQGWGQAFCEDVVYDSSGQLLSGSLMDYAMPRLGCMPVMQRETLAVPTTLNLLGAKGVGESGCTGSLPSLANAMMSALRPLGIHAMDMPFTSAKVWAAITAAKRG
jgi:carbon-monoxide dehydrogenase large subunit